jgi:hypothetical protein
MLLGGGEARIEGLLEKRDEIAWLDSSSIDFVRVLARGGRCFFGRRNVEAASVCSRNIHYNYSITLSW